MMVPILLKKINFTSLGLLMLFLAVLSGGGCAGSGRYVMPVPVPADTLDVPQPEPVRIHTYAEYFDKQVMVQLEEALDLSRQFRNLTDSRIEAKNVTASGGVANSSWYTNRISTGKFSIADLRKGPDTRSGPDTSGIWTVIRAKAEGVTPGFSIRDSRGDIYVIKFDPIGFPEMASGAEVVSTKLFYAMGYNTPENYITYFRPDILLLDEEVKFTDKKGKNRFMREEDLAELLNGIQKLPDGRIRALASRYLDGKPMGPFTYRGLRKDDLNDVIPHEDRRELRGLRILAAWLNHFDTKDGNSLDMYVTEGGRSYVKHYLIDFGATLGSASHSPNVLWRGYQYDIDPGVIIGNLLALGLYVKPWEKQPGVQYPSIGLFNSDLFQPMEYKPQVPNPAFQCMTLLDGYWAAKIVMSFSDDHLQAAIDEGQYSNPEAASFLFNLMRERRDIIGHYFFNRVNPLDNFRILEEESGNFNLCFDDLALSTGLVSDSADISFKISAFRDDEWKPIQEGLTRNWKISLPELNRDSTGTIENLKSSQNPVQLQIECRLKGSSLDQLSRAVSVYLKPEKGGSWTILGVIRER